MLRARRVSLLKPVFLAMKNPRILVFLSALAVGTFLLVKASPALSGRAAEGPGAQSNSHEVQHGKSPITDRAADQSPAPAYVPTADELVNAVIANELSDREHLRKWIYNLEKRAGKQTLTELQVESKDGPLYRLLAIDGTALNPDEQRQDDARIGRLMKDPRPLLKLKQAEDEDELKLQRMLSLMPHSFVYEYDGVEENLLRVKFHPNPDYVPPTYEARVIHSLAGTVLIDPEHKRLAKVSGQLMNRVDFGYGLLGRIDSGSVEFVRVEVGPEQWKTALINIQFSGRAVLFKTVSKDQYERRSDFRAVSSALSLSDAKDMLYFSHLSASSKP